MVEVITTDEFNDWYAGIGDSEADSVAVAVERLEQLGVTLPFPHSSAIEGTKFPLRELRIQSGGRPIRIFYAFDPSRDAVLLIGGDKTGDDRFYERMVPVAEAIWVEYLTELQAAARNTR